MSLAIYGCWRGHSTKREFRARLHVLPEVVCDTCGEPANMFSVIEKPINPFKVIDGGKK
jgi:hypothetical protein